MSISSETRKAGPYAGNGVTTNLPFSFKVFSTSDVRVVQTDPVGAETDLTLTTHYTVSLNADQDANPGGTVVMVTAPATGYYTTLTSKVQNLQAVTITNLGGFYPKILNDALDRLTIMVQQVAEQVSRAVKVGISSSSTPDQLIDAINTAASTATAAAASASGSAGAASLSAASAAASAASAGGKLPKDGSEAMTGNLQMGAGTAIIFEGATDDAFETTLTVVDPTADQTITLPNMTGQAKVQVRGDDVASAATINLTTATGDIVDVTGTTAITAITLADGLERQVRFTGALTLTNGASLDLPGGANIATAAGDRAVFRGYSGGVVRCMSYTKANGQPVVGGGQSMVRLNTANGYGSTNTKIRRFTNTVTNTGSDITYADSATNGASFTINTTGKYAISYSDQFSSGSYVGISKNSSQLTTSIESITVSDIAAVAYMANASAPVFCGCTLDLTSGDVIRAHTGGVGAGSIANGVQFTITRVA